MKHAIKTKNGFKTVIAALQEEEQSNKDFIASITANASSPSATVIPPTAPTASASSLSTAFPATTVKLASILKNKK